MLTCCFEVNRTVNALTNNEVTDGSLSEDRASIAAALDGRGVRAVMVLDGPLCSRHEARLGWQLLRAGRLGF